MSPRPRSSTTPTGGSSASRPAPEPLVEVQRPSTIGALPAGLSREELVGAVRQALDGAVPPGSRVVLAVSGGPDSTALAYLVAEARADLAACVAHVRHGLRDDRRDAAVAAAHAAALGLAYDERAVAVHPAGNGVEAAAREARYQALIEIAAARRAGWILTGHTADDQAETVLLNIARGTGLAGVAGMRVSRRLGDARLVRPLLAVRRADVAAFVAGDGLAAVADPTNRDPHQRRARARHAVLPALASLSGGPGDPVGALTRLAHLARADADALEALASAHCSRLVVAWGPVRAVATPALAALPGALATRVLRLMLAGLRGTTAGLTAGTIGGLLRLGPGEALHVPGGIWVTCGGGWLAAVPVDVAPLPDRCLAVPGRVELSEIARAVVADLPWEPGGARPGEQGRLELGAPDVAAAVSATQASPPAPLSRLPPRSVGLTHPPWAILPAEVGTDLAVRARRPGDRLRLAGGRRTLADLLVDHGVPRALRPLVPVVVDAADEPVWVPGVALRAVPAGAAAGVRIWLADHTPHGTSPADAGGQ